MSNQSVMSGVYIKLTEFFYHCTKKDVNFSIAKVLISKIHEFPDVYIEEIAMLANTTSSSVSKFCKRLGYHSFTEMKNDVNADLHESVFDQARQLMKEHHSLKEAYEFFFDSEREIMTQWYKEIDEEQLLRIGSGLQHTSKVAVLTNNSRFSAVNLFRELLSKQGITVFNVDRNAEDDVLASIFADVDVIFVISLSQSWVERRLVSLKDVQTWREKMILLTSLPAGSSPDFEKWLAKMTLIANRMMIDYRDYFHEVIVLPREEASRTASNYFSLKKMYVIFILLALASDG